MMTTMIKFDIIALVRCDVIVRYQKIMTSMRGFV